MTLCICRSHLFYGLEQVLFVWSVGWDAAVPTKLQRGHENTHGILLVFGEAVLVIVQHLIQVQWQLGSMLSKREEKRGAEIKIEFLSEKVRCSDRQKTRLIRPLHTPLDPGWGSPWGYPDVWDQTQIPVLPSCQTEEVQGWVCAQAGGRFGPEKCPDTTIGSFATADVGLLHDLCCPVRSQPLIKGHLT